VLYNDNWLIDGAVEAVRWVQEQHIPYLFVANTTSRSRFALVGKLADFGVHASEHEILTPAVAAAGWLRAQERGEVVLFVRTEAQPAFSGLLCLPDRSERGASYFVVGELGEQWDYRTLNRAFRLLHDNPQAQLVALGLTRYWMAADGVSLDVAPFVEALEYAVGRRKLVFGKPAIPFLSRRGCKPELGAGTGSHGW
jgi:phospholysine phosphohistidine inorganic pyrophosphate phosphatase